MLITKDNFDEVCKLEIECIRKYGWKCMFEYQPESVNPKMTKVGEYVLQVDNINFLADKFTIVDKCGGLNGARNELVKLIHRKWCVGEIEILESAISIIREING